MTRIVTCILVILQTIALAQDVIPETNWWMPNGEIKTIVKDEANSILYVGGAFDQIYSLSPNGAIVNSADGEIINNNLDFPDGGVNAVISDGSGGWFIGGAFVSVGGQPRNHIAHMDASGHLTAFNPDVTGTTVHTMALSGGILYIGGQFNAVGGLLRNSVAAIDAITGSVISFNPHVKFTIPSNLSVKSLAINDNIIYVGGVFDTIDNYRRNGIAAIDLATGNVLPWNPSAADSSKTNVNSIVSNGNAVYIGGVFDTIGGQPRNNIAAINASTGDILPWNPNANNVIYTMAFRNNTVFAGGDFTEIGGQSQSFIAAIDANTANILPWNPNSDDRVHSIFFKDNIVYLGGEFDNIGGQARYRVAAIDATTLLATPWHPHIVGDNVAAINAIGNNIYIAGSFNGVNGKPASKLAAFNTNTGMPVLLNFNVSRDPLSGDAIVNKLLLNGNILYIGGQFDAVAGEIRNSLAAFNTSTNTITSWDPNISLYGSFPGFINDMVINNGNLYIGGLFTDVGIQLRTNLAAVNSTTGLATSWEANTPELYGAVSAVAVTGNTIYVGGNFTTIGTGNQPRNRIAALDAVTGNVLPWNPNASAAVNDIVVKDNIVYVAGSFRTIGGQSRNRIAALDASGNATAWNPNASSTVTALALHEDVIYLGGLFTSLGGQPRSRVAGVRLSDASLVSWNPTMNSSVSAFAFNSNTIYVGGAFSTINGRKPERLGVFTSLFPLSVKFLDIQAFNESKSVRVNWQVDNEEDVNYYDVEKSFNGKDFNSISKNHASGILSYTCLDSQSAANVTYYRIKAVGHNNTISYSSTVQVYKGSGKSNAITVFPNPVENDVLRLQANGLQAGSYRIDVYNALGQGVVGQAFDYDGSAVQLTINMTGINSGVYFVKLSDSVGRVLATHRILK